MQTIAERLHSAHLQIVEALVACHRAQNSVQLLAVSKTKPVSDIEAAYAAGQRLFGENYVQEGIDKIAMLKHLVDIEWHLIGPLQSNKTRQVAEHFAWVQSLDREKIATRLHEQRPLSLPPLNLCVQVNIDDESSKSGVRIEQLDALIQHVLTLPRLQIRGLMAIPDPNKTKQQRLSSLQRLHDLFLHFQQSIPTFDTLSVGMSDDMADAIAHGSTMVRIGTAIFGARDRND